MADISDNCSPDAPTPNDVPAPPVDMVRLAADLDAAEVEEDAGQIVPWGVVEAELLQMAAVCRDRIARSDG